MLTSSVAALVRVADEVSIKVTVRVGAAPFQLDSGTNFNWSVLLSVNAVDTEVTELAICTQVVPL